MKRHEGRCLCGQLRFSVEGEPLRVGLCHCANCRRESGSAFTWYGVWPVDRFEHAGATAVFGGQHCCQACNSPVFAVDAQEAEIKLGALEEAPSGLMPSYELWVKRREPWLAPVPGAEQYEEDRS
ncbi:GFA family protein [Pseudoxanthomonas suwonensis]|uniref:GFA family protein n=1 Tax=Pseudoxanthomonas suwonensis TaxID=314722 RepID=UPI00048EA045|nr:GFA family protein [Pseudoxanthomonas suwonensis]